MYHEIRIERTSNIRGLRHTCRLGLLRNPRCTCAFICPIKKELTCKHAAPSSLSSLSPLSLIFNRSGWLGCEIVKNSVNTLHL